MATTTVPVTSSPIVRSRRGVNIRQIISYGLLYAFLIFLSIAFLFPFYSMLIGSLMPKEELFRLYPVLWPPDGPTLTAYRLLLKIDVTTTIQNLERFHILRYIFNSLLMATVAVLLQVFFNTLAGYVFAKRQFPFKNQLFAFILLTMLMPTAINFVPFYILIGRLGWMNTYLPFWIPGAASAFGIFMMRQFIVSTIPDELIDSATIDGASQFTIVTRIVMPIMAGGMVVLGILGFVSVYNEFVLSSLILKDNDIRTVQVALANFKGTTIRAPMYDLMFAGSVMATVPLLILFFVFQRKIVQGIMSGAIKG
ncbi:MAG: carbohydrate ABC transporter permease [Anaerolineae bacterium]|nr:carbohydrate ABC transporter permease [Thermoflexales bacterium]MDW8406439.1 carbohydrate ABC transporter permease [Anaerolineae bacterium]